MVAPESRTKANFKALRECVGLSQADIADYLGVTVRTVKRWESEGGWMPSDAAWELLDAARKSQTAMLGNLVASAEDMREKDGRNTFDILYFRNEMDFEQRRDGYGYGRTLEQSNANARAAAILMDYLGSEVRFVYVGEDAESR